MCRRNLNANIIVCNNVDFQGFKTHFSGVDTRISFDANANNQLVSKPFHAVVCLTAVFSPKATSIQEDIMPDTAYDFALAYYDGTNERSISICDFQHEFYAENRHTQDVSFATHKIDVSIAEGHIAFPYNNADYVDLVLLVRPSGTPSAKWTRQTVERVYIQTT